APDRLQLVLHRGLGRFERVDLTLQRGQIVARLRDSGDGDGDGGAQDDSNGNAISHGERVYTPAPRKSPERRPGAAPGGEDRVSRLTAGEVGTTIRAGGRHPCGARATRRYRRGSKRYPDGRSAWRCRRRTSSTSARSARRS